MTADANGAGSASQQADIPVAPTELTSHHRRDAICLFLTSLIAIACFTHILPGSNDGSRFSLAMALATSASAEIGPIYHDLLGDNAIDEALASDKLYSDKAPLAAFLATPALAVSSRLTDSLFVNYYVASLFGSGIPGALCPAIFYLLMLGLGVSRTRAIVCGLSLLFCTNLFYWSTLMYSHSLSSALVLGGITGAVYARQNWQYALAGLLAGLSVSSDYYLLLALPFLGIWCWRRRGPQALVAVTVGCAIAGIFPALYHVIVFGHPLVPAYHYATHLGEVQSMGIYGVGMPQLGAVLDLLIGSRFGLFKFNPVLLLGLPGLYFVWRRDRWLSLLLAGPLVTILVLTAGHQDPSYGFGTSWGPRYLVPFYFAPIAAAAFLPGRLLMRPALIVAALSLALNLSFPMIYQPSSHGEGLRHLVRQLAPVVQDYGGMSTPVQYLAAHTSYYPRLMLFLNLALFVTIAAFWTIRLQRISESSALRDEIFTNDTKDPASF